MLEEGGGEVEAVAGQEEVNEIEETLQAAAAEDLCVLVAEHVNSELEQLTFIRLGEPSVLTTTSGVTTASPSCGR